MKIIVIITVIIIIIITNIVTIIKLEMIISYGRNIQLTKKDKECQSAKRIT